MNPSGWTVYATVVDENGSTNDSVTVYANGPYQARIRGLAHLKAQHPGAKISITSVVKVS